ncbi:hypothetical protein V6M85_07555 [Sulfolobus tengchongensis]|uniref:Uncharacterized protein n=1 Tax=Sulfolobus tengchongensis TaxID=207809 RepID=A0AAX4KZB4_9CREN
MDYQELVKKTEEIARIIIRRKARKILGIYYAVWGFYGLILALIYMILDNLNVESNSLYSIIPLVMVLPFIYYTVRLFSRISTEYMRIIGRERKSNKQSYVLWFSLVTLLIILFILTLHLGIDSIYFIAFFFLYDAFVAFSLYRFLYSKHRLADPRYYDIIAIFSILLVPLGIVSPTLSPVYMIFEISWFYASINSLLEVSAIE